MKMKTEEKWRWTVGNRQIECIKIVRVRKKWMGRSFLLLFLYIQEHTPYRERVCEAKNAFISSILLFQFIVVRVSQIADDRMHLMNGLTRGEQLLNK
jgi:hypothetical protein